MTRIIATLAIFIFMTNTAKAQSVDQWIELAHKINLDEPARRGKWHCGYVGQHDGMYDSYDNKKELAEGRSFARCLVDQCKKIGPQINEVAEYLLSLDDDQFSAYLEYSGSTPQERANLRSQRHTLRSRDLSKIDCRTGTPNVRIVVHTFCAPFRFCQPK